MSPSARFGPTSEQLHRHNGNVPSGQHRPETTPVKASNQDFFPDMRKRVFPVWKSTLFTGGNSSMFDSCLEYLARRAIPAHAMMMIRNRGNGSLMSGKSAPSYRYHNFVYRYVCGRHHRLLRHGFLVIGDIKPQRHPRPARYPISLTRRPGSS